MGESFELRVKQLFGSKLFDSVPSNSFPSSSWSVAGGDVEWLEWNRERGGSHRDREDEPISSSFYDDDDGCLGMKNRRRRRRKSAAYRKREFDGNLVNSDDDDDDVEEEEEREREDEEKEIRDSVGLDPTLDYEDEEDEYDKAAVCRETTDERLYMRDVKDYGPHLNFHAIIPDCLEEPDEAHSFYKDPRADHFAAGARLKEDKSVAYPVPPHNEDESLSSLSDKVTENNVAMKPILKRKEDRDDKKPRKRVRFDPECKDDHDVASEELHDFPMAPRSIEASDFSKIQSLPMEVSPVVPDYIRNPSKYTHYTFDLSECGDDATNRVAFEDFLNLVKRAKPDYLQSEFPVEPPKSVAFTPRRKSIDDVPMDDTPRNNKGNPQLPSSSVVIAAGDALDDYACRMDEDVPAEAPAVETNIIFRRDRQYRSKPTSGDSG